ncbi:hypothetical protein CSUI_001511 [Cystoisospora suis]|uniref:Uncharacterized protein n=1 Tax=Cystoisospora suis TaxID=483139 RepID=A0A2C6LC18_9APIC|nr:hypothetical protein CSUI_001511 [Cystoisospora suis]
MATVAGSVLRRTVMRRGSAEEWRPHYVKRTVFVPGVRTTPSSGSQLTLRREFSSVKFMDQKRSGEETVYFKKEAFACCGLASDEVLLRNLLANHPEYDPKYSMDHMNSEMGAIARDITLGKFKLGLEGMTVMRRATSCQKHGMKEPSAAFLKDLLSIFSSHGYTKAPK